MIRDRYHTLKDGDRDSLEECPDCGKGCMVPTSGDWYQCSHCGTEARMDDFGLLWFYPAH